MAQNYTPLDINRFQKNPQSDANALNKILLIIAVITAVVLIVLILLLFKKNSNKPVEIKITPTVTLSPTAEPFSSPTKSLNPSPESTRSGLTITPSATASASPTP